jgi:two-component system phosphate regulon response regulator PhoB
MSGERILVVEDETDILEVIEYNLKREGYRVTGIKNGHEALRRIRRETPELVVLDLMLPGMDGIEVCRQLKRDPLTRSIPIIMVTAKGEESDIVLGLGVGADDYVPKPFSPKELMARVRAVLRRGPLQEDHQARTRISRQGLVIDPVAHKVTIDEKPLTLTATEFRLLHTLAAHPGRAFSRDDLLTRVIGQDVVVLDRNIDVHVRAIRKKLGPYRDCIETVRGLGYRFREESV